MNEPYFDKLRSTSFNALIPFWDQEQTFLPNSFSDAKLIESVKALEKRGAFQNEYLVVYSPKEYKALYFSESVFDVLGYTSDELVNLKTFAFFNLIRISQLGFIYDLKRFRKLFKKQNILNKITPKTIRGHYVGMKLRTKRGHLKTFLIINQSSFGLNFEMTATNLCSFIDISHLYEADFYWGLYQSRDESQSLTKMYCSSGAKYHDLMTPSEKGILKLVKEGYSKKDIIKLLGIDSSYYDSKCETMVKRSGAKDITSFMQICKYCGVL